MKTSKITSLRLVSLALTAAAIALMLLPWGVETARTNGPDNPPIIELHSYFDTYPAFGGGNFSPLICAYLSVIALFVLLIRRNKPRSIAAVILLGLCVLLHIPAWFLMAAVFGRLFPIMPLSVAICAVLAAAVGVELALMGRGKSSKQPSISIQ